MKVAVVGNAAGGKTYLSRLLSQKYSLPLVHVDSIQFLSGMKIRPHTETIKRLRDAASQEDWIIDGYGPLDVIEERFLIADYIIFIDLPLWRHYMWGFKRQIKNIWTRRPELPEGCNEASLQQTIKLFKTIGVVHKKMRPELIKIFNRDHLKGKMIFVRTLSDFQQVAEDGFERA